ncbi:YaiO family outer membrane beta-barrel protein [Salmonella enterica]
MKKILTPGLVLLSSPVIAATTGNLTVGYDYTNYSHNHGTKNILFADLTHKLDNGAVVLGVSQGRRDYGNSDKFDGTRGRGTIWYDWTPLLSSRSSISVGNNSPVFVRREFLNDFNLKFVKNTVLTLGARHAQYYNNTEVNSLSAGGAFYIGPLITTYRYTCYDTVGTGNSESHLLSLRLRDVQGGGYTQLFASTGTGAYTYDWTPETRNGKLHNLSVKRVQPLTEYVSLVVVLGKQWFDTPVKNYSGVNGLVGVEWGM